MEEGELKGHVRRGVTQSLELLRECSPASEMTVGESDGERDGDGGSAIQRGLRGPRAAGGELASIGETEKKGVCGGGEGGGGIKLVERCR